MYPHLLQDSQNIRPYFLCKIFFPSGHINFDLNNPPLSPILWEIKNIVTPHKIFFAIVCLRYPYVYFISSILFKGIIQRLLVIIHLMFLPKDRIRVITYLTIFSFYFLQNIIFHCINQLIIWHLSLRCICTLWSGMYQNNNIIVIRIIDKGIITGEELLCKKSVHLIQ